MNRFRSLKSWVVFVSSLLAFALLWNGVAIGLRQAAEDEKTYADLIAAILLLPYGIAMLITVVDEIRIPKRDWAAGEMPKLGIIFLTILLGPIGILGYLVFLRPALTEIVSARELEQARRG